MCLHKIVERWDGKSKRSGFGYKVLATTYLHNKYINIFRSVGYIKIGEKRFASNEREHAACGSFATGFYQAGFHIFTNILDACVYAKDLRGLDCSDSLVIVKVAYTQAHTRGTEQVSIDWVIKDLDIIVADRIKYLEQVAEVHV